jgi:spore coat protein CotH
VWFAEGNDALMSLLSLLLIACNGGNVITPEDTGSVDTQADTGPYGSTVYDVDRLLEVNIELDAEDWYTLRYQARNFLEMLSGDCLAEPFESPYEWFTATATVDGVTLENIGVRKKGLLGSVVSDRPSLKLNFDKYEQGQLFEGVERLTLNNSRQDGSRIKACIGYSIYADAGLPASRCSYAHVTVNGEDLGVYVNVEPIKKDMLRRVFDNDDGNLYEGTLSDFLDGWTGTFDFKSGEADTGDIQRVTDALDVVGEGFEAAVDSVVNLDSYFQSWSLEALIGHWDSYSGNRNNFYVYGDPNDDGRFTFLPWGIDAILEGESPFGEGRPTSVTGSATLPSRLLGHSDRVDRYEAAIRRHLAESWDEDTILARIDHAESLTRPYAWPNGNDGGYYDDTLDNIRDFVRGRRAQVEAEWAGEPPDAAQGEPGNICLAEVGSIDLPFSTTQGSYGTKNTWSYGEADWDMVISGVPYNVEKLGTIFGEVDGAGLWVVSGQLEDGSNIAVYGFTSDPALITKPGTIVLDWSQGTAYLLIDSDGDLDGWEIGAYLGGTLTLTEADPAYDSALEGVFDLVIYGAAG